MPKTSHSVLLVTTLLLTAIFAACGRDIISNPLAWPLDGAKIPDGYRTYTLFFNASAEYQDRDTPEKLTILRRNFKSFGDSIGGSNLAVWVNEPSTERLSVSRGKEFADLFALASSASLNYNDGPFVVVCDRHPDLFAKDASTTNAGERPQAIVIGFRNISSDLIVDVLNFVEQSIRRDNISATGIGLYAFSAKMKSWWAQTDRDFIKKVVLAFVSRKA